MKTSLLIPLIQFLLILLFVYAAVSKLSSLTVFQLQLSAFPFIGNYARLLSWCVPSIELCVVVLLVIPKYLRIGLYAALILLLLFTFFLIAMLSFSKNLPCSCGGIIAKLSWQQHVVFNSFFIIITGTGIFLINRNRPVSGIRQPATRTNFLSR